MLPAPVNLIPIGERFGQAIHKQISLNATLWDHSSLTLLSRHTADKSSYCHKLLHWALPSPAEVTKDAGSLHCGTALTGTTRTMRHKSKNTSFLEDRLLTTCLFSWPAQISQAWAALVHQSSLRGIPSLGRQWWGDGRRQGGSVGRAGDHQSEVPGGRTLSRLSLWSAASWNHREGRGSRREKAGAAGSRW